MLEPDVNHNKQRRSLEDLRFEHILSRFFKSAADIAESLDLLTFKSIATVCEIAKNKELVIDDQPALIEFLSAFNSKACLSEKALPYNDFKNFLILLANACNEYNDLVSGNKQDTYENFYHKVLQPLLANLDPYNKSSLYNKIFDYNIRILENSAIEELFSEYMIDDQIEDTLQDDEDDIDIAQNMLKAVWQEITQLTEKDSPLFIVHDIAEVSSVIYREYLQYLFINTDEFQSESQTTFTDLTFATITSEDSDELAEIAPQQMVINNNGKFKNFLKNTFASLVIKKFSDNIIVIEFVENQDPVELLEADRNEIIRQIKEAITDLCRNKFRLSSIKIETENNSLYLEFSDYSCQELSDVLAIINDKASYGTDLGGDLVEHFAYTSAQERIIKIEFIDNPEQDLLDTSIEHALAYVQNLNLSQPTVGIYAKENLEDCYNIRITAKLPKYLNKQVYILNKNIPYMNNYSDIVSIDLPEFNFIEFDEIELCLGSAVLDSPALTKLISAIPPLKIYAGYDAFDFWETHLNENVYSPAMLNHFRDDFLIEYKSHFNKGLTELMLQLESIIHYNKGQNLGFYLNCDIRETGQTEGSIFYLEFDCLIYRDSNLLRRFAIKSENVESRILVTAKEF